MCEEALEFECEMSWETSAEAPASIRDFSSGAKWLLGVSGSLTCPWLGPWRSGKPEHSARAAPASPDGPLQTGVRERVMVVMYYSYLYLEFTKCFHVCCLPFHHSAER